MALKAPAYRAVYDWTGFYIGAHTGYSYGSSNNSYYSDSDCYYTYTRHRRVLVCN